MTDAINTDDVIEVITEAVTGGTKAGWVPLALLLGGGGVLHFVKPKPYESLMPKALGDPKPWIFWSGVAEIACAVGLAVPRTRRVAALASAALFVGVFPGNLTMTQRALTSEQASTAWKAGTIARLPLQWPMISRALKVAKDARR